MGEVSLIDGHIDNEKNQKTGFGQTESIRVDAEVVKYIESKAIKNFAEALKKRIIDKYPLKDSDVLYRLILSEINYYANACFIERGYEDIFETGI